MKSLFNRKSIFFYIFLETLAVKLQKFFKRKGFSLLFFKIFFPFFTIKSQSMINIMSQPAQAHQLSRLIPGQLDNTL